MPQPIFLFFTVPAIPIIIEDFRHRKISVLWLAGIVFAAFVYHLSTSITFKDVLANVSINFCFIIIHYIILTAYFSLKYKKIIDLRKNHLGIGDIVFLIAVSFLLSPVNFVCFFLLSLFFSLLFTLIVRLINPENFSTIPLAGLQALFLVFMLLIIFFSEKKIEINNDQFLIRIFTEYAGIN